MNGLLKGSFGLNGKIPHFLKLLLHDLYVVDFEWASMKEATYHNLFLDDSGISSIEKNVVFNSIKLFLNNIFSVPAMPTSNGWRRCVK